jgi:hypothetical protein
LNENSPIQREKILIFKKNEILLNEINKEVKNDKQKKRKNRINQTK